MRKYSNYFVLFVAVVLGVLFWWLKLSPHLSVLYVVVSLFLLFMLARFFTPRTLHWVMRRCRDYSLWSIMALGLLVVCCSCFGHAYLPPDLAPANAPSIQSEQGSGLVSSAGKINPFVSAAKETLQVFALSIEPKRLKQSVLLQCANTFATILAIMLASKGVYLLFRDSIESFFLQVACRHVVICGLGRIGRQVLADVTGQSQTENNTSRWARRLWSSKQIRRYRLSNGPENTVPLS